MGFPAHNIETAATAITKMVSGASDRIQKCVHRQHLLTGHLRIDDRMVVEIREFNNGERLKNV